MFEIDYNAGRFWFQVFTWIAAVTAAAYAWWANRNRVTTTTLNRLDKRIDEIGGRIGVVEKDMKQLPSQADIRKLHDDLSGLRADVREMSGTMRGLNRAVDLMTEHLINKGDRG